MTGLLLLAGCGWAPARVLADAEHADVFAIEAHGRTIAGTALVATRDGRATLHAITPTGTDLFEVRVDAAGARTSTADPQLGTWLDRMPFGRDLTALYRVRCEAPRCRFEDFRLVRGEGSWRIRGPGGPATFAVDADRWHLEDARRGYTLTVVPGAAP